MKDICFMKQKIKILIFNTFLLLIVWVSAMSLLSGCNKKPVNPEPTVLNSPTDLQINGYVLSWAGDENAAEYKVTIRGNVFNSENGKYDNEKTVNTTETEYDLSMILSPEEFYEVYVTAIGDGERYLDSDDSFICFDTEPVTQGLEFTLNEDGESYTVKRGTAEKKGRIVFPDTYEGKPITFITGNFGVERIDIAESGKTIIPITSVRLPLGLTEIGPGVFAATAITELRLPSRVKEIQGTAFAFSPYLATLTLNDQLETIGPGAFIRSVLTSVEFPNTLKKIEHDAFAETRLENVVLPESIESVSATSFAGTPWLDGKPDGLVYIGNICYCYKGIPDGSDVVIKNGTIKIAECCFQEATGIKKVIVPSSITEIPYFCFYKSEIQEIILPDTLVSIGANAFGDCAELSAVGLPSRLKKIGGAAFFNCKGLKAIELPDALESIGGSAFSGSGLESITIPQSVKAIGSFAFAKCQSLTEIRLPDSEIDMGENVFSSSAVKSVVWQAKLGDVPERAFQNCSQLEQVVILSGTREIGAYAFYGTALQSVVLPDTVTAVRNNAFGNCLQLASISFPDGLKTIGGLTGCTALTKITIPDGVTEIGNNAFKGCTQITEIAIPQSVTQIGKYAFSGCTGLTRIDLPEGLSAIEDATFLNCTNLSEITIPDGIVKIGADAFSGCTALTKIDIPSAVTEIGKQAFAYTGLSEATLPHGLKVLNQNVFLRCRNLGKVIIPSGITEISTAAFASCPQEISFFYEGDETQFQSIVGNSFYSGRGNITIYYYSETQPAQDGNFWHYDTDGKTPVIWKKEE